MESLPASLSWSSYNLFKKEHSACRVGLHLQYIFLQLGQEPDETEKKRQTELYKKHFYWGHT